MATDNLRASCKTLRPRKTALSASLVAAVPRLPSRVWSRRSGTSQRAGADKGCQNHRFFEGGELCNRLLRRVIPFFLILLFFSSCFSRPALMTYDTFDKVQVGTPVADLQSQIGRPYAVHQKEGGTEEYEYVERINVGNSLIAENHYFLIVKNGKVIGKYVNRERPPAYDLIYQEEPNYPSYAP